MYTQNEIEAPKSEMNPGLMMDHGARYAFESLTLPERLFPKQTLYSSAGLPRTHLSKVPIKIELDNDIDGS